MSSWTDATACSSAIPLDATELASLLRQGLDATARREMSERAPSSVVGFEWSAVMSRFENVLQQAWAQLGAASPPGPR